MKKKLGLTAMLLAFVAMAATGSATTLCANDAAAAATVAVVGGGSNGFDCTIGGLEFSNFVANNASNSTGLTVNLVGASIANGFVTLVFNPNMSLTGAQDILLFFTVTGGINQIDLQNGGSSGTSILERACSTPVTVSGACDDPSHQLGSAIVAGGGGANVFSSTFTLTSPVYIFKDIQKSAGFGTEGSPLQHLSSFSQSFHTAVPEPMTLSMMGIGLLGLGLARRRQQGKK